jgi:hypothetical protein
MILSLILATVGLSLPAQAEMPQNPFVRPDASTDISQMADIARQVGRNLGDIPPEVQRIAFYQFKADPREFTPGMLRGIQSRVEEEIRKNGKTVVNSPELRTLRVISTDSTFRVSNAAPTQEDLWQLAEKLRVDGFLEGNCTRSAEGDLMVSLKIFKAKGGDVVWSGNFVAGPNRSSNSILDIDFSISLPTRILPLDSYHADSATSYPNATLISDVAFEMSLTEAVTEDRRFLFTVSGGYSHFGTWGLPDSVSSTPSVHMLTMGADFTGVFFRKANPDQGYWLGTYIGYREFIPLLYRDHLSALALGYRSKLSKHFSLSAGILIFPNGTDMVGQLTNKGQVLKGTNVAYDVTFFHYTF